MKPQSYTFSGHETFSLRISWLPKAVKCLEEGENPFVDQRRGMELLGLGKNMVRSLAFWVVAAGLAEKNSGELAITEFAKASLSPKHGLDPYLENPATLWLVHWNLCRGWRETEKQHRHPFAWYYFSNLLTNDEISASEALGHFRNHPDATGKSLSEVTLQQHFDVFMKTYVASRTASKRVTPEDALDSPLVSLGLLHRSGERRLQNGKREEVFRVNHSPKVTLSLNVVRYCLHCWWNESHADEQSASLQEVALGGGAIGKTFCLPEAEVYRYAKELASIYPEEFELKESRSQRVLYRLNSAENRDMLNEIYA